MQKKCCLLFLIALFCGCSFPMLEDKEFTIEAMPYHGSELKIDGYYYLKHDKSRIYYYVFYSNGVVLQGSSKDIYELDAKFHNTQKDYTDDRLLWGPFIVKGNELRFEHYNNTFPDYKWRIITVYCTILNDTTFRIDKGTLSHKGKDVTNQKVFPSEYHFRQYSPKPDSTNTVVP